MEFCHDVLDKGRKRSGKVCKTNGDTNIFPIIACAYLRSFVSCGIETMIAAEHGKGVLMQKGSCWNLLFEA